MPVLSVNRDAPKRDTSYKSQYDEQMNLATVLKETRGLRTDLPLPPHPPHALQNLTERARHALYEVMDPELPISILDLGLVSDIEADELTGVVTVSLTFTATACPCMDFIKGDVRERLLEDDDICEVEINTVWDPPWTSAKISNRGRKILESFGVAL